MYSNCYTESFFAILRLATALHVVNVHFLSVETPEGNENSRPKDAEIISRFHFFFKKKFFLEFDLNNTYSKKTQVPSVLQRASLLPAKLTFKYLGNFGSDDLISSFRKVIYV